MDSPDRSTDDAFFADQFPKTGQRTTLAQLMNTTPSQITQQLAPENRDKSYFHCGKLALFAAYSIDAILGGARGDVLWNDMVSFRERLLGVIRPSRTRFPSRLAHEVIEVELNAEDRAAASLASRRGRIRQLIAELEEYDAHLAAAVGGEGSRDGEGSERAGREADTQRPRPVAARS